MKKVLAAGCIISVSLIACSKRESANTIETQMVQPHYDTTAIDSFSAGATTVDIVRQIRMSSQKYQDSLKEAAKIEQEEKRITAELEKENKKKAEEEKKLKEKEKDVTSAPKSE
jgi:maltose-binding protein MalE